MRRNMTALMEIRGESFVAAADTLPEVEDQVAAEQWQPEPHDPEGIGLKHFQLLCSVLSAKKEALAIGDGNRVKGALGRPK